MSDYQPKPGTGSIFPNDRKEKETHPDIRGDLCLDDGSIIKIAGWRKQTRAGKTFYSLKIDKPREDTFPAGGGGADRSVPRSDDNDPFSDPIPF